MTTPPDPNPALDWEPKRARVLGEQAAALMEEFLERLPDLPVDRGLRVGDMDADLLIDVPEDGIDDHQLLQYLRRVVFDYSMYPGHPQFMAYISGAGTVPGAVADYVAAGINQNAGGWRLGPGATELELHLARWLAARFGLPEGAGGLLVSGGSMANLIGLKVARDRAAGLGVRSSGLNGVPLVAYTSDEVHFATTRAADMLGLGTDSIRLIATDDRFRIDMSELERTVRADLAAGLRPFCVVASLGTVGTGAIDPLPEIAELCRRFDLWFHVDAAYGGPIVLSDELGVLASGVESAHSIAFDPHKWMYTPHSGGCILVRDLQWLADSFSSHATYVHEDKERTGRGLDLGMMGPQLSRSFWALKVWVSLLAHGRRAYGERIAHDAALARYLASSVLERDEFELSAPVELSICCFRYVPPDLPAAEDREQYLDRLNEAVMAEVQMDGRTYYSNAVLRGRFVLRACIVNFRTEAHHLDTLLDVTSEIGRRVDSQLRPNHLRARR